MKIEMINGSLPPEKIPEVCRQLEHLRSGVQTRDAKGRLVTQAQDATLADFLKKNLSISMEKFFYDLGIDPQVTTVDQLMIQPNERWLVPEIFREAIRKGLYADPTYRDIITAQESIPQPTQVMPYVENGVIEPEDLREAEDIPFGTITYGSKTVRVYKCGVGFKITYEAVQYCSLSLAALMIEEIGTQLALKLDAKAVIALLNGDQDDGSQSAPIIGVGDTGKGLQYSDEVRVFVRGGMIGRNYTRLLANETGINTLLGLAEHKNPQYGKALVDLNVKSQRPRYDGTYPCQIMPANKYLFVDKGKAIVQLTAQPLMVESEKIIQKQLAATVATITTGFAVLFRNGRVVIDQTKSYTGNYVFPSWMTPQVSTSEVVS